MRLDAGGAVGFRASEQVKPRFSTPPARAQRDLPLQGGPTGRSWPPTTQNPGNVGSDQNRLRSLLTAAVKRAVDLIGREASGPMRGGISIQFIDSSGKIKDAQSLAQEIKNNPNFQFNPEPSGTSPNVSLQVMGHRTNSLSGLLESYQILQFDRRLTQDDLDKLASGKSLWEPEDLSSLLSQYDKKYHDIEIDLGSPFEDCSRKKDC